MNYLIFMILFVTTAWAKPLVLISYYDAFNKAPFNNSEKIAKELERKLNTPTSSVEIKLCALNTVFDVAYAQTENCLKELAEKPVMILGLGESTCELKIETMMRNVDKTFGPDNGGNERNNSTIVNGAPSVIGLRYPLPQMYCALSSAERDNLELSNFAGSFVCNNTAFQMSYYYADIQYGFIHVPANNCSDLARRSNTAIIMLEKMITKGVSYLLEKSADAGLPHSSNELRLSLKKDEIKKLRRQYEHIDCMKEYFKRAKAADERRNLLKPALMN